MCIHIIFYHVPWRITPQGLELHMYTYAYMYIYTHICVYVPFSTMENKTPRARDTYTYAYMYIYTHMCVRTVFYHGE